DNGVRAIALADELCQNDAQDGGLLDIEGIHAWLSIDGIRPSTYIKRDPNFGPIQTADGTQVAQSTASFSSGLEAPIDKDIYGNPVLQRAGDDEDVWTAADPAGKADVLSNCRDWTSNNSNGRNGNLTATDARFTTDGIDL